MGRDEGEKEKMLRKHAADVKHHLTPEELRERKQSRKTKGPRGKAVERPSRVSEENWDDLLDRYGHSSRRRSASDRSASPAEEAAAAMPVASEDLFDEAAVVISVASGRCRVFRDGVELDCTVPPELAIRQKSALAVGDRVVVSDESGVWKLQAVLPRRSVLARPDPLNQHMQRLIAANIDVVVHVVSVKSPPLRPRLIDRYLIAIQRGGAQPVVVVNKIDLLDAEELAEELEELEIYRGLGVPVIPCSTHTGEGFDELRSHVEGRTAALVGHSGVGKSSILNALNERLELATREVGRRGTGRHTTTASTLYDFGGGTYLIDTPGIREFGLWNLNRESLRDYFPEFDEPSEYCRFTNCTHVHEPDCEVQARVEAEELSLARYEAYVRLWEELE